jgi:hypothetical protein
MPNKKTYSRIFYLEDQQLFAKFCGDFNPIHLDSNFARRTIPGSLIVHGVNATLWALEKIVKYNHDKIPQTFSVDFLKSIHLNHRVTLEINDDNSAVMRDDFHTHLIKISWQDNYVNMCGVDYNIRANSLLENATINCFDRIILNKSRRFMPTGDKTIAGILYPSLMSVTSESFIHEIASMSKLVGMDLPGKNSIFLSMKITFGNPEKSAPKTQKYRVVRKNQNFRIISLDFQSFSYISNLKALCSPPPLSQKGITELKSCKRKNEFQNMKTLIVGGSRGIGELAAKLISANGGSPIITYNKGEEEAKKICSEAHSLKLKMHKFQLDILKIDKNRLLTISQEINSIMYFPTPKIYSFNEPINEKDELNRFRLFYCEKFEELLTTVLCSPRRLVIFVPSSVAIDQKSEDLKIYARAKLEAEEFCTSLCSRLDQQIIIHRLPRILTDQTQSLLHTKTYEPEPTILPILQKMNSEILNIKKFPVHKIN